MKKRVIVDMDGVIADIYSQFLKYEFNDLEIRETNSYSYSKTKRAGPPIKPINGKTPEKLLTGSSRSDTCTKLKSKLVQVAGLRIVKRIIC